MKSNSQSSFYFSPHLLKAVKGDLSAKPSVQSPYLKAVLSGKTRTSDHSKAEDSNMAAALRYIAGSK